MTHCSLLRNGLVLVAARHGADFDPGPGQREISGMDAREHRDRGVGGGDPSQWYRGLPIRSRLLLGAGHFVVLFVGLKPHN